MLWTIHWHLRARKLPFVFTKGYAFINFTLRLNKHNSISRDCNSAECETLKTHLAFKESSVLQMRLSRVLEGISKANRYQYEEIRLNTSSGNHSIDLFVAHVLYDKATTLHLRSHIFQNNSHNIVTPWLLLLSDWSSSQVLYWTTKVWIDLTLIMTGIKSVKAIMFPKSCCSHYVTTKACSLL